MSNYLFSDFGQKLCGDSGINQLMDDLGKPIPKNVVPCRMGGGNPARIPVVEKMFRSEMERILANGDEFENLIGKYDAPQGRTEFIDAVAEYLRGEYGWKIDSDNIAITNGSQTSFFYLFNMFSGKFSGGGKSAASGVTFAGGNHSASGVASAIGEKHKVIVCPLVPEYVGYADQGIYADSFVGIKASWTVFQDGTFKYHVDFNTLEKYLESHDNVGAIAVTRPTNPTGNVLTDEEITRLSALAKKYNVPLFVDNAYGLPWPDIIFTDDAKPYWDENVVLSMSLSKIGLPSVRTGIIIAPKEIAQAVSKMNAIAALASASFGQALCTQLIKTGKLVQTARDVVRPFYKAKSDFAWEQVKKNFEGTEYYVHKREGSIFLWLWLPRLKCTTKEFYALLKAKGVFVMPGEYFFFGDAKDLPEIRTHEHYDKCLRLNYSSEEAEVKRGIEIIAEMYKANSN